MSAPLSSLVYPCRLGGYYLSHLLGMGTYGEVRFGVHEVTGEKVACKIVDIGRYSPSTQELMRREISILSHLQHENCIGLLEVREGVALKGRFCDDCGCTDGRPSVHGHCVHCQHSMDCHSMMEVRHLLLLVQELAVGGEMFGIVSNTGPFNEDIARYYFMQLVSGVEYLHKHRTFHRDLKLENLVLDHNFTLKIIDFGLAAWRPRDKQKGKGSGKTKGLGVAKNSNSNSDLDKAASSSSSPHHRSHRHTHDIDDPPVLDDDDAQPRRSASGEGDRGDDGDQQQFKLDEEETSERDRDSMGPRASSRSSPSSSSSSEEDTEDEGVMLEEPVLHTGVGCVEASTNVRIAIGGVKMAKDIQCGDILINEEGRPQSILSVSKGESPFLYKVCPSSPLFQQHLVTHNHDIPLLFNRTQPFFSLPERHRRRRDGRESLRFHYLNKELELKSIRLDKDSVDETSHGTLSLSLIAQLSSIAFVRGDSVVLPGFTMKITPVNFLKLPSVVQGLFSPVVVTPSKCSPSSPLTIRVERVEGPFTFYGFHVSDRRHNIVLGDGTVTGNSLPYSSPEVFYREVYQNIPYKGSAADIWSLGVILYILLLAKPPFLRSLLKTYGPQYKRDKHFIAFMRGETFASISPSAKDLISKMMKLNPADRLTLKQIKSHEFFRGPTPSEEVVVKVMEEKSIRMWNGENKSEMVDIMKVMRHEEDEQRRKHNAGTATQAINIPMNLQTQTKMMQADLPDVLDSYASSSPPFSLVNPLSLPASFAMTPSLHSLSFNPSSAADYLAQHERSRGIHITPLSSSPTASKVIIASMHVNDVARRMDGMSLSGERGRDSNNARSATIPISSGATVVSSMSPPFTAMSSSPPPPVEEIRGTKLNLDDE